MQHIAMVMEKMERRAISFKEIQTRIWMVMGGTKDKALAKDTRLI